MKNSEFEKNSKDPRTYKFEQDGTFNETSNQKGSWSLQDYKQLKLLLVVERELYHRCILVKREFAILETIETIMEH